MAKVKEENQLQNELISMKYEDTSDSTVERYNPIDDKLLVSKVMVLDKLQSGLENGTSIDYCLQLSLIYKNLC